MSNVIHVAFGDEDAMTLFVRGDKIDELPERYDEAEALYRRAIALSPDWGCPVTNLGNVRYRQGHLDEALALYRRAIELDPKQPEAHYNLGYLLFIEEIDPSEAMALFLKAIELDSSFVEAHYMLAWIYDDASEPLRARWHWHRVSALDPESNMAAIAKGKI